MTFKTTTAFLAICFAVAPSLASADSNFPDKDNPRSIDSVVLAAVESVEIAKNALIQFDAYDEEKDPAKDAIKTIKARGYYMQRDLRRGHMYAMGVIMEQVKGMEDQAVRAFVDKRSTSCILMDDGEYEARPGTGQDEAASFCRERPDWKRYEAEVRAANSTLETGDTAQ